MENLPHKKSLLNSDFYKMKEGGHTLIKILPKEKKKINKMISLVDLLRPYSIYMSLLNANTESIENKTLTFQEVFEKYKVTLTEKEIEELEVFYKNK